MEFNGKCLHGWSISFSSDVTLLFKTKNVLTQSSIYFVVLPSYINPTSNIHCILLTTWILRNICNTQCKFNRHDGIHGGDASILLWHYSGQLAYWTVYMKLIATHTHERVFWTTISSFDMTMYPTDVICQRTNLSFPFNVNILSYIVIHMMTSRGQISLDFISSPYKD